MVLISCGSGSGNGGDSGEASLNIPSDDEIRNAALTAEGDWNWITWDASTDPSANDPASDVAVKAGSPLDLSNALKGYDTRRHCATFVNPSWPDQSTAAGKEQANRYLDELTRNGYNLVRFHWVVADTDGNAQTFIKQLSDRGIHWAFDVVTSDYQGYTGLTWQKDPNGGYPIYADQNGKVPHLRANLYFKDGDGTDAARSRLYGLIDRWGPIMKSTKPDFVDISNEGGIYGLFFGKSTLMSTFDRDVLYAKFKSSFNKWLIDYYTKSGSTTKTAQEKWAASWGAEVGSGEYLGNAELPGGTKDEVEATNQLVYKSGFKALRYSDFSRFVTETQDELNSDIGRYLEGNSYFGRDGKGRYQVSSLNNEQTWDALLSKSKVGVSEFHIYHDHPYAVGSPFTQRVNNTSSLSSLYSSYILFAMGQKFIDQPLYVTEYQIVYPNTYRYEAPLFFGVCQCARSGWFVSVRGISDRIFDDNKARSKQERYHLAI